MNLNFSNLLKRIFDIFFSLFILVIFCIPLVIICILIKLETEGPAIHWSKRFGLKNKIFMMPKLRTMLITAPDQASDKFNSYHNITNIGKFLRKTSLDEIPQFYSVLVGDMSCVGPRPALHNQLILSKLRKKNKIDLVLPGITGYAQIFGRDRLSILQKVKLDKLYIEKKNFIFDLYIIFKTCIQIFKFKDISH